MDCGYDMDYPCAYNRETKEEDVKDYKISRRIFWGIPILLFLVGVCAGSIQLVTEYALGYKQEYVHSCGAELELDENYCHSCGDSTNNGTTMLRENYCEKCNLKAAEAGYCSRCGGNVVECSYVDMETTIFKNFQTASLVNNIKTKCICISVGWVVVAFLLMMATDNNYDYDDY